jgi:hypothetical protein
MGGICNKHGETRNAYKILFVKSEWETSTGARGRRWEGNVKMNFREIGHRDVDWIHVARDWDQWRVLVSNVMKLRVP